MYTSEVAREAGVHPNTVRLYETWGFLPPIQRSEAGYRLFTHRYLTQIRGEHAQAEAAALLLERWPAARRSTPHRRRCALARWRTGWTSRRARYATGSAIAC